MEKDKNETVIITVIDSFGTQTPVDTFKVIYKFDFPGNLGNFLEYLSRSDTCIETGENGMVIEWEPAAGDTTVYHNVFIKNDYANKEYDINTMPTLVDNVLFNFPAVRFTPKNHSNLRLKSSLPWVDTSFTLL